MYKPTNFIRQYIREHGNFTVSDEEFDKIFELIYVFNTIEDINLPNLKSNSKVQEFRKTICSGCSQFNVSNITCNLCGCSIDDKITYPTERCPINKWTPDISLLKQKLRIAIDYLNTKASTDFFTQPTVEETEEEYRKIIEEGKTHE